MESFSHIPDVLNIMKSLLFFRFLLMQEALGLQDYIKAENAVWASYVRTALTCSVVNPTGGEVVPNFLNSSWGVELSCVNTSEPWHQFTPECIVQSRSEGQRWGQGSARVGGTGDGRGHFSHSGVGTVRRSLVGLAAGVWLANQRAGGGRSAPWGGAVVWKEG